MEPSLHESFWDYREHFRQQMGQRRAPDRTAEGEETYQAEVGPAPINERLVQTIWAQQLVQPSVLRLADGRPLRVLDPGRWNGTAGPDFKDAHLMIGPETLHGDVEVHLKGRDWQAHGHQRDLAYNTVVLHVVLHLGDGRASDTLHNGLETPRLELEPYLFPDLDTLRRSLTPDDYEYARSSALGRCQSLMTELDPRVATDFLDRAGDERLIAKMQRLDEQARYADAEQVFHQALMMSLGSGPGKTLYYLLAKRTPLAEMMDYVRDLPESEWGTGLEALLLHVGGLVPTEEEMAAAPAESRARAATLRTHWRRFEPYWCDRAIPPTRRWFQGIRPVNFPVRRLAGVATLLARAMRSGRPPLAELLGQIRAGQATLAGAQSAKRRHPLLIELLEKFRVPGEGHFWGTHYSFAAKPAERSMDLIGEGAALSLVLNALLPVALLAARQAGDDALGESVHRLFGLVPPLQSNHITEFMTWRLFGDNAHAARLINTERRRQGLFQVFYACCNSEARHCESCYYLDGVKTSPDA